MIPLTSLTPPHFCACPKARHGFPSTYAVDFAYLFNDLRWEVDVRLVVHVASCIYISVTCRSPSYIYRGPVVVVIVWQLDLQLPMQSESITTYVTCSNPAHGELNFD